MGTRYQTDIIAWANAQGELLRSGRVSEPDSEHLAEEIEDVGKGEQRELASRLAPFFPVCSSGVISRSGLAPAGNGPSRVRRMPSSRS